MRWGLSVCLLGALACGTTSEVGEGAIAPSEADSGGGIGTGELDGGTADAQEDTTPDAATDAAHDSGPRGTGQTCGTDVECPEVWHWCLHGACVELVCLGNDTSACDAKGGRCVPETWDGPQGPTTMKACER